MTTTKAKRFNKDGIEIADVGPLLDRQRRSFPLTMMDSALVTQLEDKFAPAVDTSLVRHAPGYCTVPEQQHVADVEAALDARDKRLTDGWKTPPAALPVSSTTDTSTTPVVPDVAAAIAARDARLENAWRAA